MGNGHIGPPPLDRMTDRQTQLKTLPSSNFVGGQKSSFQDACTSVLLKHFFKFERRKQLKTFMFLYDFSCNRNEHLILQQALFQALEQTTYDGVMTWKITDFAKKRQDAIAGRMSSVYSPPFYTSRTGYKMCARLYLNGDGMGKGTHLSLFFVVMKGRYDALLKWPFRHKVR